jgi:naringenin degradation protein FdeH
MKSETVRRVVTGHDETGKAIVVSDGAPPVIIRSDVQPGLGFYEIWNTPETPSLISGTCGEPTLAHSKTSPPAGGTVIRIVDLPPEGPNGPELSKEQAEKLFAAVGLEENTEHVQPGRHPLMHRTESIDYGIVLSGEIVLLLDDSETVLRPGDVVVQRGTIHAWSNRTDDIARIAFVLTDGRFDDDLSEKQRQFDASQS